jgi:hypothetical protein
MDEHRYSTFALDLYWAADASRDPELETHVAACERCRAYLDHLRTVDARDLVLPARARPVRKSVIAAFAFAVVLAAAILLWLRGREPAERTREAPTYVATKSAPAVQVLVRRDGATRLWEAEAKLRGHDALALRVACEAMTRVAVLVAEHGEWKQTFTGACQNDVLPFTLVVDDEPGDERVAVVLGRAPLDEDSARHAAELQIKTADIWALTFVFAKESQK